jgi:hypothetical protein
VSKFGHFKLPKIKGMRRIGVIGYPESYLRMMFQVFTDMNSRRLFDYAL